MTSQYYVEPTLLKMFLVKISMKNTIILKDGVVKVIQVSDTHLFANDELEIFGAKSNIKFKEVIERIRDEDSHDADMIFLTGDISQDETVESYRKIVHDLSNLNLPVYWIPGNHDNLARLESVFLNAKYFRRKLNLSLPRWHLIFLNTKIDGRDDGQLSLSELKMLKESIAVAKTDQKIAIIMHHHPAPVGTPLIDNYILKNTKDFWDIISITKVELIICGHVHGDYCFKHNNVMIESSPATCLQWEKGTKDLKINMKIGYKVYYFEQDGYRAITKMW